MEHKSEKSSPKNRKKILIINWKWNFGKDWEHLNEHTLKKHRVFLEHIEQGHGRFFQEFAVQPSNFCPDALVIATSIYIDGDSTRQLLFNLINQYVKDDHRVLLLMHRPNARQEDLRQILKRFPNPQTFRCLFFEGGRDYIYYPVQESGLLDDVGNFYQDGKINVLGEKNEVVLQPYFDRVWKYYEGEFEQKVLALKEDLFDCLFPAFLNVGETIPREDLERRLQQNQKELLLRLDNFMGQHFKHREAEQVDFEKSKEIKAQQLRLAGLEKKEHASYGFDDGIAHLDLHPDSLEAQFYREARDYCHTLLFDQEKAAVSKSELQELVSKFDLLVKVIPGVIN